MADADNLPNPHFTRMDPQARFDLIRGLRTLRRAVKEKPAKQQAKLTTKIATRKRKNPLTGDLAGFTKEQLQTLMELLDASD